MGSQTETVERSVPTVLGQLSETGGLFESLKYINMIINFLFFDPLDLIEFFYAMQDLDDQIPEEEKFERNEVYQYF